MTEFSYTAVTADGINKKGTQVATSAREAREKLRETGLIVLTLQPKEPSFGQRLAKPRVSLDQLTAMTYQLSVLLSCDLTVSEAIESLTRETPIHAIKIALQSIQEQLQSGHSLAQSLQCAESIFPPIYRATVEAGEKIGQLPKVLSALAIYLEKQQKIKKTIQKALIYPSVLVLTSIAIVTFLLVFTVPNIIGIFSDAERQLPLITQYLILISNFLTSFGIYLLIFILLGISVLRHSWNQPHYRLRLQKNLLKIPKVSDWLRLTSQSKLCRTTALLFSAGIPLNEALCSANSLITLLPMHQAVSQAIVKINEGYPVHLALKETKFFDSLSLQLISSGEISGKLATMLHKVADQQEMKVNYTIDVLLTLFEPLIILTMGVAVLFIVLAMLLPIFEMNQLI